MSETAQWAMRVTVLCNPQAGGVDAQTGQSTMERLQAAFRSHGIHASFVAIEPDTLRDEAERALHDAREGKIDAVVVGGGDGTVRTVASVLVGTDVPLGVLPLGTLNHFAKDLGISIDPVAAVTVIAGRQSQYVDTVEVNGLTFVNNSSIGLYPYLVLDRDRRRRQDGHSKWVAAGLAAVRALRFFPLRRLTLTTDQAVEPFRSPCVFIGNNEYGLSGPAFASRERLDDGTLCIFVTKHQSRASLIWYAVRTFLGVPHNPDEFRILHTAKAEISSSTSRLLVALDGEVEVLRTPLRYTARPRSLRVFVPPASE